jgi:hypothetical protein
MDLYWTLVFLHVIAFAYWLGVDFGVYVTGGYVARADLPLADLPLAERLRFLAANRHRIAARARITDRGYAGGDLSA